MGGSSKNTTNTVAEPWKEQKPYLIDVFDKAQAMYGKGQLSPAYYSGQTVADQSDYTKKAIQMQANRALNGSPVISQASTTTQDLLKSGLSGNAGMNYLNKYAGTDPLAKSAGYKNLQTAAQQAVTGNGALSSLNDYAGQSDMLKGDQGYSKLLANAQAALNGNAGMDALEGMAGASAYDGYNGIGSLSSAAANAISGNQGLSALNAMSSAVNPYSESLLGKAQDEALSKINGNFSQAGRYGSGAHEAAAADAVTDLANQFYANAYDQQMNAANAASSAYNQGISNQTAAAQAQLNALAQDQQMRQAAAQAQGQLYNQAAAQQLDAYNNASSQWMQGQQNKLDALSQAGSLYNQGMDNRIGAYNAMNDAFLQNQQNLLNAATDAGNMYNQGMSNLFTGAGTALDLGNQAYQDAAALSEAGGVKDDYQQMLINAAIDRYNYDANSKLNALSNYMQLINGTYGGTSTSTGKQGDSGAATLGTVIGGATTALSAADLIRSFMS